MKGHVFFLIFSLFFFGCRPQFQVAGIGQKGYAVAAKAVGTDTSFSVMLKPYADSINKTMNEVLAESDLEMRKEMPNSVLGNFLADAYLWAARQQFNPRAEIAFMNHGGVRINRIGKGPITRSTVYEVMPFDNTIVILEVKGDVLQQYLDRFAADGGGGGVAGLRFSIRDGKAVDVRIGDRPLDPSKTYTMVNSDYQVVGGGGFTAFKKLAQNRTGYLMRDAIIDYCRSVRAFGKKLSVEPLQRISK